MDSSLEIQLADVTQARETRRIARNFGGEQGVKPEQCPRRTAVASRVPGLSRKFGFDNSTAIKTGQAPSLPQG